MCTVCNYLQDIPQDQLENISKNWKMMESYERKSKYFLAGIGVFVVVCGCYHLTFKQKHKLEIGIENNDWNGGSNGFSDPIEFRKSSGK